MWRNDKNESMSSFSGLLCGCVCKAELSGWVTLVGSTLGCGGKRLVRSIKKGKLDLCSAD